MNHRFSTAFLVGFISLFFVNSVAHALNISSGNPALYHFNAPGNGPFPSIKLDFLFPAAGPSVDTFDFNEFMTFGIYDNLNNPVFYQSGASSGFFSSPLVNALRSITIAGFIPPFPDNDGFVLIKAVPGSSFDFLSLTVNLGTSDDIFNPQLGAPVLAELVLPNAIPEPDTILIFGVVFIALTILRRALSRRFEFRAGVSCFKEALKNAG